MKNLKSTRQKALRLAAHASLALVALVSSAYSQEVVVSETITLRSGDNAGGSPLAFGADDTNITHTLTTLPVSAVNGSPAKVIEHHSAWTQFISDPDARWIHSSHDAAGTNGTGTFEDDVLYAHRFDLPASMPGDAIVSVQMSYAADDRLETFAFGDALGVQGIQTSLTTASSYSSEKTVAISGSAHSLGLKAGENYLFIQQLDTGGSYSGVIYSMDVKVDYCKIEFDLRSGFGEIPEDSDVKVDVIFLADTTGSMTDEIGDIQADIASIINDFAGMVQDIDVGVASYKDFNAALGSNSGYVYRLEQKIADISTIAGKGLITNAVGLWQANGGGGDGPEAQLYALHRLATDPDIDIGWRANSIRMIVYIGDSPGHDPICTTLTNGNSPITEASVIADLKGNGTWGGTKLIAVNVSGPLNVMYPNGLNNAFDEGNYLNDCGASTGLAGQADRITQITGGSVQPVNNPTLVADAVEDAFLLAMSNGIPFPVGSFDPTVMHQTVPNPYASADLLDAYADLVNNNGLRAMVVEPKSTWLSSLSEPAGWIHSRHIPGLDGSGQPGGSVLYAHEFTVPNFPNPSNATLFLSLEWAADESLYGVSLNGPVLSGGGTLGIGGSSGIESSFSTTRKRSFPASAFNLVPGQNKLYLSQLDTNTWNEVKNVSGIMYIAKLTISYQCEQEISYDTFCECHLELAPCGNSGQPGQGCANSTGVGSSLTASGTNTNTNLHADNLPLSGMVGLFFKGNSAIGPLPFGDGLRCAGGNVIRLGVVISNTGEADLHLQSSLPAGEPTAGYYQFWYRDNSGPCGFGFNLSSAIGLP